MEGGRWRGQGRLLRLHPPLLFPLPALPGLPLSTLAPRTVLGRHQLFHIRGGEEV